MTSTLAEAAQSPLPDAAEPEPGKPRSLGSEAWEQLRGRPMFWFSSALIVVFILMAVFPRLFTSVDPFAVDLDKSRQPPSLDSQASWFGYDSTVSRSTRASSTAPRRPSSSG